jgi:hypothetical protein
MKHSFRKLVLFILVFTQFGLSYLAFPQEVGTAPLLDASVTLGNARLSYKAGVSGTPGSGATAINIDGSGNPDNDTNHLFPNDSVCFSDAGENGCTDEVEYSVNSIVDTDTFTIASGLSSVLEATDLVVASQSGSMVITFETQTEIPATGNLLVTIPSIDHATKGCDGIPDHSSSTLTNGFDLGPADNRVGPADISVTGCTDGNWNETEVVECGTAVTDHTIEISRQTASCASGSTITITIDDNPGIINPAPITSGHTQGEADVYRINVKSRDSGNTTLDEIDVQAAPIEGVHVSATVDDTLSFTVAAITADSGSYCGVTRTSGSPDTTATTVPFGTVSDADDFTDTNQQLTVSTNAGDGYTVYVEENDELGLGGATTPLIPDTPCNAGPCTHTTSNEWTTTTVYGFGYSLQNASGTDAGFLFNESGRTFSAKQFPNIAGGDNRSDSGAEVMSNSGPVSGSSVYVCYRLNVSGTQEAGTYFNNLKYTAVPQF